MQLYAVLKTADVTYNYTTFKLYDGDFLKTRMNSPASLCSHFQTMALHMVARDWRRICDFSSTRENPRNGHILVTRADWLTSQIARYMHCGWVDLINDIHRYPFITQAVTRMNESHSSVSIELCYLIAVVTVRYINTLPDRAITDAHVTDCATHYTAISAFLTNQTHTNHLYYILEALYMRRRLATTEWAPAISAFVPANLRTGYPSYQIPYIPYHEKHTAMLQAIYTQLGNILTTALATQEDTYITDMIIAQNLVDL